MTAGRFVHLLVTRYAVPAGFAPTPSYHLDPAWLDSRAELLSAFCLPSVLAQTDRRFVWVLMADPAMPGPQRERLEGLAMGVRARLLWTAGHWRRELVTLARGALETSRADYLITTRLDSDDGIHRDFMDRVHSVLPVHGRTFIEFTNGYSYSTASGALRLKSYQGNPFVTLIELRGEPLTTVYCGNHGHLRRRGDPFWVYSEPRAWLQVIHGGNRRNLEGSGTPLADGRAILKDSFGIHRDISSTLCP